MRSTVASIADVSTIDAERLMSKVLWRIVPFLFLCYLVNFIDRTNVSFAALTMNQELAISPTAFGGMVGLFFFGYFIFEIPSNLMMQRFGARIWITRIMLTWGAITIATAFVQSATQLYIARFLLGVAEAGFTPGVFLYLCGWFPAKWRAKALAAFLVGIPVSTVIGGPLSSAILGMHGLGNLQGWRWLFLIEGIPAIVLGLVCLPIMIDKPSKAPWLSPREKAWIEAELHSERLIIEKNHPMTLRQALTNRRVVVLALTNFSGIVGLFGIGFWMPQIIKGFGLSNAIVGFVTAIPFLFGAVGMVLWARNSDRTGERVKHVAASCLLAAAGLAASSVLHQPILAMIALTAAIVGVYAFQATFWALPPAFLSGRAAAGGIAMIVSIGNLGGFVGPYLVGWLKQTTQSFFGPLLVLSGFLVLAAILVTYFGHHVRLVEQLEQVRQ